MPEGLHWNEVTLRYAEYVPASPEEGLVPKYVFKILDPDRTDVGHVSFKVGENWHVMFAVGHVGYAVERPYRGHGYAHQACRALVPFLRSQYESVIITTSPENTPSIRTIEKLGGVYLGAVEVPESDPSYAPGHTARIRYEWRL